jgi:hypothetical protein
VTRIGNVVFAVAAMALIVAGVSKTRAIRQ